jgi:GNAT superfamily N-acetyltransferase
MAVSNPPEGYRMEERPPTVEEYQRLRTLVGWGPMTEDGVAGGLPNALYSVVLVHEDEAVGCGRMVGDGGMYFYVQDVIVLPEHQGRGLGMLIMDAVMAYLERTARPGAFVGLMAATGVAPFYERYGFARRGDDQPGMFRVW